MAKLARKRSTVAGKSVASSRKRANHKKKLPTNHAQVAIRPGTKQSIAIEMLRSSGGASIDALTQATKWQQHSVRGFLAGVVRRRLKLDLRSAIVDGIRTYRIIGDHGRVAPEKQSAGPKS